MRERTELDRELAALSGRTVLVTGHSGFKGGWLCHWLHRLGARIVGVSLPPETEPSFFASTRVDTFVDSRFADIRDPAALSRALAGVDAEVVFHLAADAIVRRSYREPASTFATNVVGTANVLDSARAMPSLRAAIVVTSDKCYENREWAWPYREDDRLGGADPYSASKACTELVAESYRRSWFADPAGPQLATVRAGNVIGGGDWAEDRLIPDLVRAAAAGVPLYIRNPRSIRPWQHVLEPLGGYLTVAARLLGEHAARFSGAWNFGPDPGESLDVETIARSIAASLPMYDVPIRFGAGADAPHEATLLRLDSSKAQALLGWRPRLPAAATATLTAEWYAAFLQGWADMSAFTRGQLDSFLGLGADIPDERILQCG